MTVYRFPRTRRLLAGAEFKSVFDRRLVLRGRCLACHVLPHPDSSDTSRLGVVVAKRLAPTAVARNRIKRVAREVFRTRDPALNGADVVVRLTDRLPRHGPRMQKRELAVELRTLLNRASQRLGG